jgi:GTPase-activator protein for Ras-like GTPase
VVTTGGEAAASTSEGTVDIGPVIGIVVGLIVLCVIALVLVALYFRKRGNFLGGDPVARLMPKREFAHLVFPPEKLKPVYDMDDDATELAEAVVDLVSTPPDFEVCIALASLVDVADRDYLAKAMAYVVGPEHCLGLLVRLAEEEVEKSQGETTLFRTDCMTSKVWKAYTQMIGMEYLYDTLARFVNELNNATAEDDTTAGGRESSAASLMSMSTEIDPTRMGEDDDESINKLQLSLVCQKAFHQIRQSVELVPPTFVAFFSLLRRKVEEKYDEAAGRKAVGGFLFLRFICPSMMTPHIYGLTLEPPQASFQRQLILVAKILQSLANDVEMGKKEPWMAPMQDLLKENKPRFEELFDNVSSMSESEAESIVLENALEVPDVVRENSAIQVFESICREQSGLGDTVQDEELLGKLEEICSKDGPDKLDRP